jgi:hypothetical protein
VRRSTGRARQEGPPELPDPEDFEATLTEQPDIDPEQEELARATLAKLQEDLEEGNLLAPMVPINAW